jgi:hypothetical protein
MADSAEIGGDRDNVQIVVLGEQLSTPQMHGTAEDADSAPGMRLHELCQGFELRARGPRSYEQHDVF